MARYRDPMRDLGTVDVETPEQIADAERKRRKRERDREVAERAEYLVDNDPSLRGDMRAARRAAREQIALERGVEQGTVDPATGEPIGDQGDRDKRPKSKKKSSPTRGRGRPPASRKKATRTVRKTTRAVVAPFGGAASAGWHFLTGGVSLVLLYVVLREADAVGAAVDGVTGGLRRFADPYTPLVPSKGEASPPPPRRRVAVGGRRTQTTTGLNAAERRATTR